MDLYWACQNPLGKTTFMRYRGLNKSTAKTFNAQISDKDIKHINSNHLRKDIHTLLTEFTVKETFCNIVF